MNNEITFEFTPEDRENFLEIIGHYYNVDRVTSVSFDGRDLKLTVLDPPTAK